METQPTKLCIYLTGPPLSGKSTLLDCLEDYLLRSEASLVPSCISEDGSWQNIKVQRLRGATREYVHDFDGANLASAIPLDQANTTILGLLNELFLLRPENSILLRDKCLIDSYVYAKAIYLLSGKELNGQQRTIKILEKGVKLFLGNLGQTSTFLGYVSSTIIINRGQRIGKTFLKTLITEYDEVCYDVQSLAGGLEGNLSFLMGWLTRVGVKYKKEIDLAEFCTKWLEDWKKEGRPSRDPYSREKK